MLQQGARSTGENWRDYWQTPEYILDLVDEFYEGRWHDPCPALPAFDGLNHHTKMPVYINPPFSQYAKWVDHWVPQGGEQIWMSNSNTETRWYQKLLRNANSMVLTNHRVRFIDPRTGKPGDHPRQGQTLFYIGHRNLMFCKLFGKLGEAIDLDNGGFA